MGTSFVKPFLFYAESTMTVGSDLSRAVQGVCQ